MLTKKKSAKNKKKVKKAVKKIARKSAKRPVTKKRRPEAHKKPPRAGKKSTRVMARRSTVRKPAVPKPIGTVTHFYREIKVAVVKFSKAMPQGSEVAFRGTTTDFVQKLDSMQFDHKPIAKAPKRKLVGIKVRSRVRHGDKVYSI